MEGHIGENRDEVEQHAEPDRTGRHQLQIAQVPQHLQARGKEPLRAHEAALLGSFMATRMAPASPSPASASNAKRQPTRSASTPGMKRPHKLPRLDPETYKPATPATSAGGHSSP